MNEQIKKNLEDAKLLQTDFSSIQPVREHYPSDKLIKTIKLQKLTCSYHKSIK